MYNRIREIAQRDFTQSKISSVEEPMLQAKFADPELLDVGKYLLEHSQTEDIIQAYDQYITHGLPRQLAAVRIPYREGNDDLYARYELVRVISPTYKGSDNKDKTLYPAYAKTMKMNYIAHVIARPVSYRRGTQTVYKAGTPKELLRILVMVRSICCNTRNLTSREDLLRFGENPDDPGGYFIHKGNISTIPGVEKLRINRFFIFPPTKKNPYPQARQTINVPTGTAINNILERDVEGSVFVKACHFSTSKMGEAKGGPKKYKSKNTINIFNLIDIIAHVFRRRDILEESASGKHYAVDIILNFICTEDPELRKQQRNDVYRELSGTILEYEAGAVSAQKMAELLEWIGVDVTRSSEKEKEEALVVFIQEQVFGSTRVTLEEIGKNKSGQPILEYRIEPKIQLICMLTCYYLLFKTGYETFTNRDDWANKKVDSAIVSMSQHFWKGYKKYTDGIVNKMRKESNISSVDALMQVGTGKQPLKTLTSYLLAPFNQQVEEGTTGSAFEPSQKINPTNLLDLISAVTKIQVNVNKKVKSRGVRSIQGSQYGYVCPAKTPDGIKCGMVKNKAILAHITIEIDPVVFIRNFWQMGLVSRVQTDYYFNVFIVNHAIVGYCNGPDAYRMLTRMRQGTPGAFTYRVQGDKVYVEPKWYAFDAMRSIDLILARLHTEIREDEDAVTDGYVYEFYFENTLLGYITEQAKQELAFESSIPSIHEDTTFMVNKFGHLCMYTDAGRLVRAVYVVRDNTEYKRLVAGAEDLPDFELLVDTHDTRELTFHEMRERGFVDYIDPYEESSPNFLQALDRTDFREKLAAEQEARVELATAQELLEQVGEELLNEGALSMEEMEERLSVIEADIARKQTRVERIEAVPIRYVSLHGVTMYGALGALAPVSQYDPAGKTSHTVKTLPQTLGLQSNAYGHRKEMSSMVSNIPLTTPSLGVHFGDRRSFIGYDVPFGFMDMPGNQEDAVIFSSQLIDLGYLRYKRNFVISTEIQISGSSITQHLGIPNNLSIIDLPKYEHLGEFGLPPIGYYLKEKQIAIAKYEYDPAKGVEQPIPLIITKEDEGRVVDIIIRSVAPKETETEILNTIHVSLLMETVDMPRVGDKFSLPHGQKSVLGAIIVNHYDLPISASTGTAPLVIFNTHAMKNRQTMGVVLEMVLGNKAAAFGQAFDSTGFVPYILDNIIKELAEAGYGFIRDTFYSGQTGARWFGYRYMGYARLQQLHHFARQKINANNYAEIDTATHQKKKGAKHGGQKMGEMEKDVLIAYSVVAYFREKFRTQADNYVINSCKACCIYTDETGDRCPHCGAEDTLYKMELTQAYVQLQQTALMQNMRIYSNVGSDEEFTYYYVKSLQSKQVESGGIQVFVQGEDNEEELGFRAEEEENYEDQLFDNETYEDNDFVEEDLGDF